MLLVAHRKHFLLPGEVEDNKDWWNKWYDHYEDPNRRIGAYLRPVPQLKGRVNGTGGSARWSFPLKSSIKHGFVWAVQITDDEATMEDAYTTERDEWVAAIDRTDRDFCALNRAKKNHSWLTEVQRREIGHNPNAVWI